MTKREIQTMAGFFTAKKKKFHRNSFIRPVKDNCETDRVDLSTAKFGLYVSAMQT